MIKKTILLTLILIKAIQLYAQEPSNAKNQMVTYITCKFENTMKHDTLSLVLNGAFYTYQLQLVPERYASQTITAITDENGIAKFKILTDNSPFHATLFLSSRRNEDGYLIGKGDISNYLIMPGDDINIDFNGDKRTFTGKGAELFEAQYKIEETDKDQRILNNDQYGYLKFDPEKWLKEKNSLLKVQLDLLAVYQSKITPLAYSIMRADVIGLNRGSVYLALSFTPPFLAVRKDLTKELTDVYAQLEKSPAYIDLNDRACLSPKYTFYLYEKIKLEVKHDRVILNTNPRSDLYYFPKISKDFKGILRDKLLACWIMDVASVNNLEPEYATDALAEMQTPSFINIVNRLKTANQKGQQVADFDFKDSKGQTVHLADFKGKVMIVDMWFTGCEVCQRVAAGLPHVEDKFKDRSDIIFVSISIDRNKEKWLNSINKKEGKYYITSTTTYLYTAGTGEKNQFIQEYVPSGSYPSMLIIDKEGKLFSSTPTHPLNTETQQALVSEINKALASK